MHGSAPARLIPKLPANYVTLQQLKERREQELQRRKEEEELKKKKEEEEREAARRKEEEERKLKEEEDAKKREEKERKFEEAPVTGKPIHSLVASGRIRQRARGDRTYLRPVDNPANDFSDRNGRRQKVPMALSGAMIRNATTMTYRVHNKGVSRIGTTSQQPISTEAHDEEKNEEGMSVVVVAENPKSVTPRAEQRHRNFDKPPPPPDGEVSGVTDKRRRWGKEKKRFGEKDAGKGENVENQNEDPRCVCPFPEIDKIAESASATTKPEEDSRNTEEKKKRKKNKGKSRKRYAKKQENLNSENRAAVYEDGMPGKEGDPAKDSGCSPVGNRKEMVVVAVAQLTSDGGRNGSPGDQKVEEVTLGMMQKGMEEMRMHCNVAAHPRLLRHGVSPKTRNNEPRRGRRNAGDLPSTKSTEPIETVQIQTADEGEVVKQEADAALAAQREREDARVSLNGRERGHRFSGSRNHGNAFRRFASRDRVSQKWMKKEDLH